MIDVRVSPLGAWRPAQSCTYTRRIAPRGTQAAPHERRSTLFFQAEDGIRDGTVTGVQTCALPIWLAFGTSLRDERRLLRPRVRAEPIVHGRRHAASLRVRRGLRRHRRIVLDRGRLLPRSADRKSVV